MAEIVFDATTVTPVQPHSCGECRSRKSKCNRRTPCGNCQRKGLHCVYGYTRKPKTQKGRKAGRHDVGRTITSSSRADPMDNSVIWDSLVDGLVTQDATDPFTIETCSPGFNFDAVLTPPSAPGWEFGGPEVALKETDIHPLELPFSEAEINRTISRYLYQIHPSMPFFSASFLLDGLKLYRHQHDPAFAAMVIAICAFTHAHSQDADMGPSATGSIALSLRLHQDTDLGESPTVEDLLTSMFISGVLWRTGKEAAAWLRLQEAINLARLLHLPDLEHDNTLDVKTWDNRARIYLGLGVIDRVFASSFGRAPTLPPVSSGLLQRFSQVRLRAQECEIVDESKHVSALRLLVHSFGRVDEGILSCLQGECGSVFDGPSLCSRTSREQIQQLLRDTATIDSDLWRNLKDRSPVPATSTFRAALETVGLSIDVSLSENEHADVLLTCYWVQMRLWNIALTHGYLSPMSSAVEAATPELSFQYAVDLATRTTDLFKRFSIRSWETHGEGVAEKCFGIASGFLVAATQICMQDITWSPSPPQDPGYDSSPQSDYASNDRIWPSPRCRLDTQYLFQIANGFLGFFCLFQGGRHPYYKEFTGLLDGFRKMCD